MDKIAGLKEILALDPKNSFARYGIAMELVSRGETAAALAEFDTLAGQRSRLYARLFYGRPNAGRRGQKAGGHRTAEGRHRLRRSQR